MTDVATFKNANILIVDDQQANIDLLEDFLAMEGYTNVKSTSDPRKVIQLYSTFKPDLILLDLTMPYLSGFELMGQLRSLITANIYLPILVLTADVSSEAKQKALAGGASDFLTKPFDLIEVSLRIKNLLHVNYLQQQLRDQNKFLEVKVKERTAELEEIAIDLLAAKNKAEASDRLKTSFLQTISHEIRTPMNGIMGFASLLVASDVSEDEKQEFVEMMETSADRLVRTITDYVDISLINSDNLDIDYQQVDVIQMLQESEDRFLFPCRKKGLTLNLVVPSDHPEFLLESDQGLLRKVFYHLITNAVKFTHKGNVTFGYSIQQTFIRFFVGDTGIGIHEDSQKQIFEKFFQLDGSATRAFEGSGLGLSICQGIIKALGGEIRVESELGKGSTFYFILPVQFQSLQ